MAELRPDAEVVLVIHVHNLPGVLARIASIFHRRALNIDVLTVGPTHEPETSRMVVRVAAARAQLERVAAAIGNLVDVLSVELSDLDAPPRQEPSLARRL
jgi:acetolactate synthase-1/3 small subunit